SSDSQAAHLRSGALLTHATEVSMGEFKSGTGSNPGKPQRAATQPDGKRRRFLLSLGAGGASAAVAGVAAGAGAATPADAAPESTSSGYRETQHVRNYYRSAKF